MTCTYTAACKTTYWQKRFFTSTENHSKGNPNTLIKLHTQYNAQQVGKYKSWPYNVSIGNQKEEDINRDMSSSQDRGRRNPAPKTMEKRRIKERQSARVNTDTESSDEWSGGRNRNGDHGMVMRPTCKQAQGRRDWAGRKHAPTHPSWWHCIETTAAETSRASSCSPRRKNNFQSFLWNELSGFLDANVHV